MSKWYTNIWCSSEAYRKLLLPILPYRGRSLSGSDISKVENEDDGFGGGVGLEWSMSNTANPEAPPEGFFFLGGGDGLGGLGVILAASISNLLNIGGGVGGLGVIMPLILSGSWSKPKSGLRSRFFSSCTVDKGYFGCWGSFLYCD